MKIREHLNNCARIKETNCSITAEVKSSRSSWIRKKVGGKRYLWDKEATKSLGSF